MAARKQKRTLEGWALDKVIASQRLRIVRATLTLDPPRKKKVK